MAELRKSGLWTRESRTASKHDKAKTKNMYGSGNPTYPKFWPPILKLFIEKSGPCSAFPVCYIKSTGCFILHIYIIARLKLSQEFQIMHNNSHYIGLHPL